MEVPQGEKHTHQTKWTESRWGNNATYKLRMEEKEDDGDSTEHPPLYTSEAEEVKEKQLNNSQSQGLI